ncbi:hypothetical protein [Neolewinella sp.]|uniref:hypothetical protein n=1 Tax=Neolewinella sp. TaxID=2993543 RepID=UPI003B528214
MRPLPHSLCLLVLLLLGCTDTPAPPATAAPPPPGDHWGYAGETGPTHWACRLPHRRYHG